jgi:DNA-binding PadR family transcriptional regulator
VKYLSRPEEILLLTVWKLGGDAYGVNIREYIARLTGKYWSIGSIYVPLDRLESKGFLQSYLGEPTAERGGKSKRYYRVTAAGLRQLEEIRRINELFWTEETELFKGEAR